MDCRYESGPYGPQSEKDQSESAKQPEQPEQLEKPEQTETTVEILEGLKSSNGEKRLSAMGKLAVFKNFNVNLRRKGLTPEEVALGYKQILYKITNRVITRGQQIRSRMSIGAMIQMGKITQAILNPEKHPNTDDPMAVLEELKAFLPDDFE